MKRPKLNDKDGQQVTGGRVVAGEDSRDWEIRTEFFRFEKNKKGETNFRLPSLKRCRIELRFSQLGDR